MTDMLLLIISGLLIYIIGYPLIEWLKEYNEEMEEKNNGGSK